MSSKKPGSKRRFRWPPPPGFGGLLGRHAGLRERYRVRRSLRTRHGLNTQTKSYAGELREAPTETVCHLPECGRVQQPGSSLNPSLFRLFRAPSRGPGRLLTRLPDLLLLKSPKFVTRPHAPRVTSSEPERVLSPREFRGSQEFHVGDPGRRPRQTFSIISQKFSLQTPNEGCKTHRQ